MINAIQKKTGFGGISNALQETAYFSIALLDRRVGCWGVVSIGKNSATPSRCAPKAHAPRAPQAPRVFASPLSPARSPSLKSSG